MKSSAYMICLVLLLLTITFLLLPSSHGFTHQIDYNDERGEYCYNESVNLGTCLGKQQQEQIDITEQQILQCMECSGHFNGDETCAELKALNDVEFGSTGTGEDSINWHESFCESYNMCVETNCPKQCLKEQDAWLQCLIIELDCDWRCAGSDWFGSRSIGIGMENGAAMVRLKRQERVGIILGVILVAGVFVGI